MTHLLRALKYKQIQQYNFLFLQFFFFYNGWYNLLWLVYNKSDVYNNLTKSNAALIITYYTLTSSFEKILHS